MADVTVALHSRKPSTGTATHRLAGQVSAGSLGTLVQEEAFALVDIVRTVSPGTLLYRGFAILTWNANSEGDLAGYRVYHGTASGGPYAEFVDVGNVTLYQWDDLLPGTTHYFTLSAYDTTGNESDPSLSPEVSKVF